MSERYIPEEAREMSAEKPLWKGETPQRLRTACEKAVKPFVKEMSVEGREHLAELPKDRRVIIVTSHFSNLDALEVINALGEDMNIQVTAMSTHWEDVRKVLIAASGEESFSKISYRMENGKRVGEFSPWDYEDIAEVIQETGKVPWVATEGVQVDKKKGMARAGVGPAYLAETMDAVILPVAIVTEGPGASVEGGIGTAKALLGQIKVTVRIGASIEIPKVDTAPIKALFSRRLHEDDYEAALQDPAQREGIRKQNREFSAATKELRGAADVIGKAIAALLPEEQRGYYKE